MCFSPVILYLWIIFALLCSPPGHSDCNSPCTVSSQPLLPTGDRTIRQPLTTKWGQDKRPGINPLALSSEWIDEGAAASPGRTWKTDKSLPSTWAVPLALGGMGFATTKWWWKHWMDSLFYRSTCTSLGRDIQPGSRWREFNVINYWCYYLLPVNHHGRDSARCWAVEHKSNISMSGLWSCLRHLHVFCYGKDLVLSTSWSWAF